MNERDYIQKILRPFLVEHGFPANAIHKSNERFKSGWPDLTAVHAPDGTTVYIEAKVDDVLTPLQRKTLRDLATAGARCYVFTWKNKSKEQIIEEMMGTGHTILKMDIVFSHSSYYRKEE